MKEDPARELPKRKPENSFTEVTVPLPSTVGEEGINVKTRKGEENGVS